MTGVMRIAACITVALLSGCGGVLSQIDEAFAASGNNPDSADARCDSIVMNSDGQYVMKDKLACDCQAIGGRDPKCWGYREYRSRPQPLGSTAAPLRRNLNGDGPEIPLDGILNSASFMNRILAAGGIAQGSIFTIFGTNLGPAAGVSASTLPLGTELAGVSIRVFTLEASVQAIPLFVFAGQINAIMPSNAPLGYAAVEVTYNGVAGNVAPVRIVAAGVGIFTPAGTGMGPASITNFISQANQPLNTPNTPVARRQFVTLWVTGLGAIEGSDMERPVDVGAVQDVQGRVNFELYVGSRRVTNIFYAGRSAEFPGLDQVVFEVPADVETGCYTPIIILTNGIPSNGVTMAIAANGGACPQVDHPLVVSAAAAGTTGSVNFARLAGSDRDSLQDAFQDFAADVGAASFVAGAAAPAGFNPLLNLPPLGTCLASGGLDANASLPGTGIGDPSNVDAGTQITVTRPDSEQRVIDLTGGTTPTFGGGLPGPGATPLFWEAGSYRVESDGGAQVGAFALDVNLPEPIAWTNRDQLEIVSRENGLELRWQSGSAGQVIVVVGNSSNGIERAAGSFVCTVAPATGFLRVPPQVLANLPDGRVFEDGIIFVISLQRLAAIQASGLASGSLNATFIHYRLAFFR
jgi:uncharacterized protein (TIGR03437 family)